MKKLKKQWYVYVVVDFQDTLRVHMPLGNPGFLFSSWKGLDTPEFVINSWRTLGKQIEINKCTFTVHHLKAPLVFLNSASKKCMQILLECTSEKVQENSWK